MSNTGNTQQIIDYGITANDGTGDPLRTAFIKTDQNFANIWAAGPVGSNITIVNNTIQSNNTNGNIVLRPNGVGVVQSHAHVVPNIDDIRNLGSANLRWRTVYLGSGGLDLSGPLAATDATIQGNLSVAGNVTITGNVVEVGNITFPDTTVQTSAYTGTSPIAWVAVPGSNTAPGTAGEAAYDTGGNLYVCVSANTWAKFTGTTSW